MSEPAEPKSRVDRLNRTLDLPMAILALAMLGIALAEILLAEHGLVRVWLDRASWTIWGLFVLELAVKLALAEDRRAYLHRHWFDVIVVLLPMFRVLRALRLVTIVETYPAVELLAFMGRGSRGLWEFLRLHQVGYLASVTAIVTVSGALMAFMMERGAPESPIDSYGTALWWSAALMTTIGSEMAPVTTGGRLVALGMMLYAMTVAVYLIGAVSAHVLHRRATGADET